MTSPPENELEPKLSTVNGGPDAARQTTLVSTVAFGLSAILSPYLVIPAGTLSIIRATTKSEDVLLWSCISIFFSTVVPVFYILAQMGRGRITDVHVMEREQRGGPFAVALASSLIGAIVLKLMHAPITVWGLGMVLFCNGVVMLFITRYWKISIHVAVLTATIAMVLRMVPLAVTQRLNWTLGLIWMIPALAWARMMRGRHSILQGAAGCCVAYVVTWLALLLAHKIQAHSAGWGLRLDL